MSATPYAIELAYAAAHAASQKKASDIIAIDVFAASGPNRCVLSDLCWQ